MTIRSIVIGRGLGGSVFHAPLIRAVPALELVAMVGADDAMAAATSPEADLIVISTPNQSHFPLAEAAEAHRALEARETSGSTILTID